MKQKNGIGASVFGELLGLVISLVVVLYIFPKLPFVTGSYSLWLPIAIWTTVISGFFDIGKFCVPKRFFDGLKAIALLPDAYSTYMMARIFPFDFSLVGFAWLNSFIQPFLYFAAGAVVIAFIVHLVKFLKEVCI